jgi:tetratricopeptide (TPR) repeat protein
VKKQIALWAGHAGREFLIWFGFARDVLLWVFGRMRGVSLKDMALVAWIAVFIVIATLIVQDLSRDVVIIEPISTPKTFAEGGYTPEVASRHLHDALNNYADNAGSMMQMHVAQSNDLPDFVVPKLDLSVHAIVISIRSALHYRDIQRITGEFIQQGKLSLHVRVDGHEVYGDSNDSNDPDALLAAATPKVMDKIRPYLVAATMYSSDRVEAVEKADEIIARVGESDVNTQWSYILKGRAMADQGKFDDAERFDRKAVELGWHNWVAHNNLGFDLRRQNKIEAGIAEHELAIRIDPSAAMPRCTLAHALSTKAASDGKLGNAIAACRYALTGDPRSSSARLQLGLIYQQKGEHDAAAAEYRKAIKFASRNDAGLATYHYVLGIALKESGGQPDEVIAEYRVAIKSASRNDESLATYHYGLGTALKESGGQLDDVIAEYRAAIKSASDKNVNLAIYHGALAFALGQKVGSDGTVNEAIAEYNSAIAINPKYSWARNNLGTIFQKQGKLDDAIGEYRQAIADDPGNEAAKGNLERALKLQRDKVAKE